MFFSIFDTQISTRKKWPIASIYITILGKNVNESKSFSCLKIYHLKKFSIRFEWSESQIHTSEINNFYCIIYDDLCYYERKQCKLNIPDQKILFESWMNFLFKSSLNRELIFVRTPENNFTHWNFLNNWKHKFGKFFLY